MKLRAAGLLLIGLICVGVLIGCGTAQNEIAGSIKKPLEHKGILSISESKDFKIKDSMKENKVVDKEVVTKKEIEKEDKNEHEITSKDTTSEESNEIKQMGNKKPDVTREKDGAEKKKENKTTPKDAIIEASGTYFIVNTDTLNVRSGGGTNYSILGSVVKDVQINVTGKTSNNWYQFDYNGKKGYVSGNFLSTTKPVEETNKVNEDKVDSSKDKDKSEVNDNKNVVDNMKKLGNSQQVILVTAQGYNTSSAQVKTFEKDNNGKWNQLLSATAFIGKNGFANNKVEGDGKTPTGKYSIGHAFGYQGNPGTKLSFKNATSNDVWVDDPNSQFYNTWQTKDNASKDWNSAEEMTHRLYSYGMTINYNTAQTPNKGSAIFMHVGNSYTVGCTATNQGDLIKIMKWIDPSKHPVIIQTPEAELSNY